jgi:hypothetical protein
VSEAAEIIEVADAEIVPIGQVSIYQSTDPSDQLTEARARAAVLVEIVREQNLAKTFGSSPKPHVFVEGWQFLASQFGLIPDIESTNELEDGWEARAALRRLSDGMVIAHADGECRRTEGNWKGRDSYAIRSMAQTRAVSKVCRIALSSVMVLAGFSATPAEDMTHEMAGGADLPTPTSTDEPHCPACYARDGVLVPVYANSRKPFWKCSRSGDECAGAEVAKGKKWSWSGWHESFERSRDEWNDNQPTNGEVVEVETGALSPGQWLGEAVTMFSEWDDDRRREAYQKAMTELGYERLSSMGRSNAVLDYMAADYYAEFPTDDGRPF